MIKVWFGRKDNSVYLYTGEVKKTFWGRERIEKVKPVCCLVTDDGVGLNDFLDFARKTEVEQKDAIVSLLIQHGYIGNRFNGYEHLFDKAFYIGK